MRDQPVSAGDRKLLPQNENDPIAVLRIDPDGDGLADREPRLIRRGDIENDGATVAFGSRHHELQIEFGQFGVMIGAL